MANTIYEKIPCGGFLFDNTVFEFKKDPTTGDPALTVTANIPTSGSEFIILKATGAEDLYKITVTSAGELKAEKYTPEA